MARNKRKPRRSKPDLDIWDQIDRLRAHLIRSLLVISGVGVIIFLFQQWFFEAVIFGPTRADFLSFRLACSLSNALGAGDLICFDPPVFRKQAIGFAEAFITSIKVSFMAGLLLAFPFVLWELWKFLGPFLGDKVRRSISMVVFVCSLLFLTGIAFGYFVLAPFSISWLMGYTLPGVENAPTLDSYINYMLVFTLPMGLIFELPVVCYFLARAGLLEPQAMRTYRRHAIVGILLVAGIITPTVDGITQLVVAFPLYLLYELSIFVVRRGKQLYDAEEPGDLALDA